MSIKDLENTKLTKEDIDKVRHIEGFPIGSDEDIIALSNPPYYTACPNPFIEDFIKEFGKPYDEETDDYHREPFAADVSEGKGDSIYNAHSYHTKVPYKAIMRYILHYTSPGDIVFDGFCGTGMTGIAAEKCGKPSDEFKRTIENDMKNVRWGNRYAVLSDISPVASFIASRYNSTCDILALENEGKKILSKCVEKHSRIYQTTHSNNDSSFFQDNPIRGIINNIIWSDVLICPNCNTEIIYWDAVVNVEKQEISNSFKCKNCGVDLNKKKCVNKTELRYDKSLLKDISIYSTIPVLINYQVGSSRYWKKPDANDIQVINEIENSMITYWHPSDRMCDGSESRRNDKNGITHVHHFFTRRNLLALSALLNEINKSEFKDDLLFVFTASIQRANKTNRFRFKGTGGLSGTLYIPSLTFERNVFELFENKLRDIIKAKIEIAENNSPIISLNSLTEASNVPNNSIDYIFTDPPFGSNLNYAELSFIWESWLKIKTNKELEAIVDKSANKGLFEYQELMTKSFIEYFRILKPGRWITVEFSNTQNAVWNAIQEALNKAGFIIADVRTLDKIQGSFKQVTTTTAAKQDLVISAYKPKESFRKEILSHAGTELTVWDFVRQHLEKLPVVVKYNDVIEIVAERQAFLLFDRMVAYHIMQGIPIPLDASDFYRELDEKFAKRDGMYFLQDQVNEYDQARLKMDVEFMQLVMFVNDEKSAIAWLYQQLSMSQTYAEIQPKFMKEIRSIEKHELLPELAVLLEDNFLKDENGKWYIPDTTKAADVMKLREKKLVKEFEEYLNSKGKLKKFRTEAVRAGFAKLWKEKNYNLIVKTADRLPDKVIQEDDKLLMYYDISLSRVE
ncbi:MAG: DNA methylase [Alkaliphilus sp.]|nr:DNA methylase [Alkaliphilus sp.]